MEALKTMGAKKLSLMYQLVLMPMWETDLLFGSVGITRIILEAVVVTKFRSITW